MHTIDLSNSEARQFTITCEPLVQVSKQLSFTDEPIRIFLDPTRQKVWAKLDATFPNGKNVTVFARQIPRPITVCFVLPAQAQLDVLWITKPALVDLAREDAKNWPTVPRK